MFDVLKWVVIVITFPIWFPIAIILGFFLYVAIPMLGMAVFVTAAAAGLWMLGTFINYISGV